jgi:fatty-acyl-CoA synthase
MPPQCTSADSIETTSVPDRPLVIDIADIEAPPETSIGEFDYVPIDRRERCRLRLRMARGTKWDAIALNYASVV